MKAYFESDIGKKRQVNEDSCSVYCIDDRTCFAIVCDGMGGTNAGEVASSLAVDTVMDRVKAGWRDGITEESVRNLMLTSITAANINIFDRAESDPSCSGMGTTVVACAVMRDRGVVAHAGDSRAYLCTDKLRQITKDHSLVQQLVDLGKITAREALTHPKKNYITRALGVEENIEIDFNTFKFKKGAKLLLCSDGLTNYVSEKNILEVLNGAAEDPAKKLVDMANENGGGDNITAVVISNE